MPAIRFTAELTEEERDSLYLNNMPNLVIRFEQYINEKRRNPPLQWFRTQLIFTESIPKCVTWSYDVDHIVPRKLGGQNIPANLIIIPSTMNRSFSKFVDRDKVAFLGQKIFDSATREMQKLTAPKQEHNPFGAFANVARYTQTQTRTPSLIMRPISLPVSAVSPLSAVSPVSPGSIGETDATTFSTSLSLMSSTTHHSAR